MIKVEKAVNVSVTSKASSTGFSPINQNRFSLLPKQNSQNWSGKFGAPSETTKMKSQSFSNVGPGSSFEMSSRAITSGVTSPAERQSQIPADISHISRIALSSDMMSEKVRNKLSVILEAPQAVSRYGKSNRASEFW